MKDANLVPGVVHCAKCNFRLNRVTLYMGNGVVAAGGVETEKCPNGCGPMWPVTWEQEAHDAYKTAESQMDRALIAERLVEECRPYLKEAESPAECLTRNRTDLARIMGKWATEKMTTARLRTALNEILCLSLEDTAEAYVIAGEALSTTDHPLNCIHINQGSIAAAADAYEEEYRAVHDGAMPRTTDKTGDT